MLVGNDTMSALSAKNRNLKLLSSVQWGMFFTICVSTEDHFSASV